MGTASPNEGTVGSGTPLIPSWLEEEGGDSAPETGAANGASSSQRPTIPEPGEPDRYTAPRTAFSKFARSGGSDRRNMGRAVSGYVSRTSGGAAGAARRMGSSRDTGRRLVGFLTDAANRGLAEALRSLNLDSLIGRPAEDIFTGLADYLCPEGGTLDASIARDAFLRTIADITEAGDVDLDSLTGGEIQAIFEIFTTHAIETRLLNEIGIRAISLPADVAAVNEMEAQLHDFIANGVADAVARMGGRLPQLSPGQLPSFVDEVFENAFIVLAAMGEAEESR